MLDQSDWERLCNIREEMNDLLEEAKNLVRLSGEKFEYNRAKAYWLTGMENYLGEGAWANQMSGCSMEETINSLEPCDEDDEYGDEDDCEEESEEE